MKTTVSDKGQVTIPKRLRDSLGIAPGDVIEFEEVDGRLVGRRVLPDDPFERVRGIITLPDGMSVDDAIDEMRGPVDG